MTKVTDKLRQHIATIEQISRVTYSYRDIEQHLIDLLRFLEFNMNWRADLEPVLIEIIDTSPDGVVQILEFTMHTLRWDGVQRALENLRDTTPSWNEKRSAERILEAWDDDWEDADLYDYYRTPNESVSE
jgi:hypothetical protein